MPLRSIKGYVAASTAVLIIAGMTSCDGNGGAPDTILDSAVVHGKKVEFYIDYPSWDSAVLGFIVHDQPGIAPYFELYSSTDHSIESMVMEVYSATDSDEMWIQWKWTDQPDGGQDWWALGYYRFRTAIVQTAYGSLPACEVPYCDEAYGAGHIPPMDPRRVKKVLTIVHSR